MRKWLLIVGAVIGLAGGGYFMVPLALAWVVTSLNTVSTDDAHINGQ